MIIVVIVVSFWRRRKTEKEMEENIWRRKIANDANRQDEYSAICLFECWKIEGRDLQLRNDVQVTLRLSVTNPQCHG